MKKALLCAVISVCLVPTLKAQSFQCPRGTEDMLRYFVMGYPNRTDHMMGPGNANPIYTAIQPEIGSGGYATQGYFIWMKSQAGFPWDVKAYDRYYIYDRSTELNWTDPLSFKRFDQDLPLSPRCISTTNSSTINVSKYRSGYGFYGQCQRTSSANLGYVVNSISKPISVNAGGTLGTVSTRYLTYSYSCNSSYSGCLYKEVFSLGKGIGLYDWKYYKSQSGKWVQVQESVINDFTIGHSVPVFACPNTYQ